MQGVYVYIQNDELKVRPLYSNNENCGENIKIHGFNSFIKPGISTDYIYLFRLEEKELADKRISDTNNISVEETLMLQYFKSYHFKSYNGKSFTVKVGSDVPGLIWGLFFAPMDSSSLKYIKRKTPIIKKIDINR